MLLSLSLLVLSLTACTPGVEQFSADFPADFCAYAVPCAADLEPGSDDTGEVSTASCEAEIKDYIDTLAKDDSCSFDGEAAQACMDSLEGATCSSAETVRDECENIFTGDDCDLQLTALL